MSEDDRAAAVWGAPFVLLVLDDSRQQQLEYSNAAASALFGKGYLDLFGTEGHELVAADDRAQVGGFSSCLSCVCPCDLCRSTMRSPLTDPIRPRSFPAGRVGVCPAGGRGVFRPPRHDPVARAGGGGRTPRRGQGRRRLPGGQPGGGPGGAGGADPRVGGGGVKRRQSALVKDGLLMRCLTKWRRCPRRRLLRCIRSLL